ncbi:uncharacterized protein LOC122652543 [Telopea speciosissima]|uniref:uncharacterized protein LOC122652543 n=1 Tax=Telopea speciosissima TaxID=54955 RepID=UPI001CC5F621|nr:uncharacterized protein LOC122652543 [Telopea speciosissima]XP_043702252.1 uncharacterized protein LOC122652543 [Telopea speciosissima]
MADVTPKTLDPAANLKQKGRPVGGTEHSWCRAVPGGTGITVLAMLFTKDPGTSHLQNALHELQKFHPILRSRITRDENTNTFFFTVSPIPLLQIQSFDSSTTSQLLQSLAEGDPNSGQISPFHRIIEHELNQNPWSDQSDTDVLFACLYALPDSKWLVALRLHTSVCDRTSAVFMLTELLGLVRRKEEGSVGKEQGKETEEFNLSLERLIPNGKANKPFWARGVDLLGYSLNALRFANLEFKDVTSPRSSQVIRLQMNPDETDRILTECRVRGIKLCGAIAAAGLIAANSLKHLPDHQWEKYAIITLIDCRKLLDPPLQSHNLGFYHSAIVNTHDIKEGQELWELASRCYVSLKDSINANKHFTDMADLHVLMCKAIDNPGLTPHSSLRTSFISVFEDPVINDEHTQLHQWMGLEDYMGCSSVHGVGPSIAVFDTIHNGRLDFTCVYPSPLHSRGQMQELIDTMKRILVGGEDKT